MDVCIPSNAASPPWEYTAIPTLLPISLIFPNWFVCCASWDILDVLSTTSAIEVISFSNKAAASAFLPAEKALAVLFNNGANALNYWPASNAAAPLPIAVPAAPKTPEAILPDITAPTANPEFLITLSNKKFAVIQLSVEYHSAFFSWSV